LKSNVGDSNPGESSAKNHQVQTNETNSCILWWFFGGSTRKRAWVKTKPEGKIKGGGGREEEMGKRIVIGRAWGKRHQTNRLGRSVISKKGRKNEHITEKKRLLTKSGTKDQGGKKRKNGIG